MNNLRDLGNKKIMHSTIVSNCTHTASCIRILYIQLMSTWWCSCYLAATVCVCVIVGLPV